MIRPGSAFGRIIVRRSIHPHTPRRPKSTSTNSSTQPSDTTPKTIPGPSWLWLEPIATPFRAYGRVQQRRPYATQFVSALVIYFVGDICAQNITSNPTTTTPTAADGKSAGTNALSENDNETKKYDPYRTARALLIGGISSIPSYKWFIWLGESFNYRSKILSLTTKVLVNQILFTPIFNSYFFGMQSILTGATLNEMVERIKHTVPVSWINSCKIWPAVTAFSFTFIPIQFRSIFGGTLYSKQCPIPRST